MNQLELYKKIDYFFASGLKTAKRGVARLLIYSNSDARDYFFAKVPVEWISWLNNNGFFEVLNKEAEDKTQYSFRMPELGYLARVVELDGDEEKVVEIMNSVDCVKNFNPEVVDQFLGISQKFSAESLVKIIPKIQIENWIVLMKKFNLSGHTYEPIVKKLVEAKKHGSLLVLAEVLLKLNVEKKEDDYFDNYFCLNDIGYSDIFDALMNLEGKYAEKGIKLIVGILSSLAKKRADEDKSSFTYENGFYISDVDLFDMSISKQRRSNDREDLKSLIAVLVALIENRIGKSCEADARGVYNKYIATLPDTQWMWRIQVFAMSRCPDVFGEDIKRELDRVFDTDYYINFLSGTEYYRIIKLVFSDWSETEQREYVEKVLKYFTKKSLDSPDKDWIKGYGWSILSAVAKELTEKEKISCKEYFSKAPDPDYEPQPSIGKTHGVGLIQDRSPVYIDDKQYKNILDLIKDLKGKLSPEILKKEDKDDFFNPKNAEGVGKEMKEDMKRRMSEYLVKAEDFFDTKLNIHYTYSLLYGVEEYLRGEQKLSKDDWDGLFKLFNKIEEADEEEYQENPNREEDRWLARWEWLEKTIANILKYFLSKEYSALFAAKRVLVLELLESLLESDDPEPKNETKEYGDLFHIAINSTRGVAFQALVNFVYQDGEKLSKDVVELYKETIEDASPSVRFVIGHYLASFYFRDKSMIRNMFELIFPRDKGQEENFFAAWEGYLSTSIYKELFIELQKYYKYALKIDSSLYPKRHKKRDVDQGVANHLALAFAHFDEVQYTADDRHPLLETLWSGEDVKKQKEFISFLGRGIISHGNADEKWFEEKNVDLEKLKDFWTLILSRKDLEDDVYSAFGFWVNHKEDIFDYNWLAGMMAETLTRSNGKIDWEFGTLKKALEFAKVNPSKTLIILEKYLLDGILSDSTDKKWFYLDEEKKSAFEELYETKPTETKALINKLLEKGGRLFWDLKDIVN
jgi:hypothetical protein